MALNCFKINTMLKNKLEGIENEMYFKNILGHFNEIPSPGGKGSSAMPCIPRQKICKKYQYEERYRPLKFNICIKMIGKCKFQMTLNFLKIDHFENVLGG